MEVVVFIAIASGLTLSIYKLIDFLLRINLDNKMRLAATMIADQQIEDARNLPYDAVGTTAGIVSGVIPDVQVLGENNEFNVNTFVQYIDDPFDGTYAGETNDDLPTDYKAVKVTVSWQGPFGKDEIITYTNIAPKGLESDFGGGALNILVFDANGLSVEGASIHVENNAISPVVNFDALSDDNGQLLLMGAQASHETYEITVTKDGYSTSYTSPRTTENPNPVKPHVSVLEGARTEISFSIDLLSNLNIRTIQNDYDNWIVNRDNTQRDQINGMAAIADDGNMYFVWQDIRGDGNSFLYLERYPSEDNPAWNNDIKVGNSNLQFNPDIAVTEEGIFFVVWEDQHYSQEDDIYVECIDNNGDDVWADEIRVNSDNTNAVQQNPKIALDNTQSTTTIAWEDMRNGNSDIYIQSLTLGGQKIWSNDILVANASYDENSIDIIFDSENNIIIAWVEDNDISKDIYIQKYDIDGNQLLANNYKIIGTSLDEYYPSLAADDAGNIYLSWTEESAFGLKDIYLAKYDSGLNEQWKSQINIYNQDSNQYDSSTLYFNSNIYVSWTDERGGSQDIYTQKFNLDGKQAWNEDIRLNMNNNNSSQSDSYLFVNSYGPPLACWTDNRNEDLDIYASNFSGPDGQSYVANVPFVITGAKKIYLEPDIYKYSENFTTNSVGEITLSDLEWDSYTIELPEYYTSYDIVMVEPNNPVSLQPNCTQEVKIYLE